MISRRRRDPKLEDIEDVKRPFDDADRQLPQTEAAGQSKDGKSTAASAMP